MVFAPESLLLSFLSAVYHHSGWCQFPLYPRQSFFRFPDKENRKYCLCNSSASPVPPRKNFCRHIIVADHTGMFIRIKHFECAPDLCSRCQFQDFRYFFFGRLHPNLQYLHPCFISTALDQVRKMDCLVKPACNFPKVRIDKCTSSSSARTWDLRLIFFICFIIVISSFWYFSVDNSTAISWYIKRLDWYFYTTTKYYPN